MIGNHKAATKSKIGTSVVETGWRRRTKKKPSSDLQSSSHWDEDFSTPSVRHIRSHGLWEESHNSMIWD